ncbi:MAG: hypothetical protein LBK82_10735 [Planctomycetaceae bacterium]|nr:hypothetical protein [Planctomycetaceae bacterium]
MTLKRKSTQFALVNPAHCRLCRHNRSANGCLPYVRLPDNCLFLTKIPLRYYKESKNCLLLKGTSDAIHVN